MKKLDNFLKQLEGFLANNHCYKKKPLGVTDSTNLMCDACKKTWWVITKRVKAGERWRELHSVSL